jgi:excisionase family DNA binding protein
MPRLWVSRALQGVEERTVIVLDCPLLTAEEVALLLAVPRSSVYEYARRRVDPLPSVLIGRHRRFDRRSVERWLSAQLAGSGAD